MISIFGGNKEEQNEAHLKNLILMARSDNDIDKSEIEVIFKIGLDRGIAEHRVKELLSSKFIDASGPVDNAYILVKQISVTLIFPLKLASSVHVKPPCIFTFFDKSILERSLIIIFLKADISSVLS